MRGYNLPAIATVFKHCLLHANFLLIGCSLYNVFTDSAFSDNIYHTTLIKKANILILLIKNQDKFFAYQFAFAFAFASFVWLQ